MKNRSIFLLIVVLLLFTALGATTVGIMLMRGSDEFLEASDAGMAEIELLTPGAMTSEASSMMEEVEPETAVEPTDESAEPTGTLETTVGDMDLELPINRIAWIDNEGQLGTMDEFGNGIRMLTDDSRRYQFPAWSPDGQTIAAISATRTDTTIALLADQENAQLQEIYTSAVERPFYFYWSPNGQQIAFLATNRDAPMGLHVVPASGENNESQLLATGGPVYWQWTSDSEQLFVHTGFTGGQSRLTFIEAAGDGSGENIADPGFFQAPGISPDGRFWSYAEINESNTRQLVVQSADTDQKYAERHTGLVASGWSPTNNQLAFITADDPSDNNYFGPLRILDADSGEIDLISREQVIAFFWSPNGEQIAYLSFANPADQDISAFLPGGKQGPGVSKRAEQIRLPALNLAVVNVETGEGRVLLNEFQTSLIFISQYLPFFDQYALSHTLWSPASSGLLMPVRQDGVERIAYLPIKGGQPRILVDGQIAFWSRQ